MRILVIDDHPDIRSAMRFFIEKMPHNVIECASGNEAISLLKKDMSFDLIISDYQMPDGDGLEVLSYLSSVGANTKFILFSSFMGLEASIAYKPFLGVISKYELKRLVEIISSLNG